MKFNRTHHIAAFVAAFGVACGGLDDNADVQLELPHASRAEVSVSAGLDVSQLADAQLRDRIVVDEITLNVQEVRLLGADPRIPSGGLELIDGAYVLEVGATDDVSTVRLPFPQNLLQSEDLAVYVRIDKSPRLEGASVIVKGRLFAQSSPAGAKSLSAESEADPDGDPAKPPTSQAQDVPTADPDGDPARPEDAHRTAGRPTPDADPDGDPAKCEDGVCKHWLTADGIEIPSIRFELRASDMADLVTNFSTQSKLDVLIGIPAERFMTAQVVAALERTLKRVSQKNRGAQKADGVVNDDREAEAVVVRAYGEPADAGDLHENEGERGDYFLLDGDGRDSRHIRQ